MPTVVIQSGHYGRTSGATGGPGEAAAMIRISRAAAALIDDIPGWTAKIIDADEPDSSYRGDAFIALHADANNSSRAVGGSVGYRNSAGRALAEDWKRAYRAEVGSNIGPFRSDNYTGALAGYYGHRRAVKVGNTRAAVVEHGFMTNPDERKFIESSAGIAAAARACCLAVTGRLPTGSKFDGVLRRGSGANPPDLVRKMQSGLADLGYDLGTSGVDGDYGSATAKAVAEFKADHPATSGGPDAWGDAAWDALTAALTEPTEEEDLMAVADDIIAGVWAKQMDDPVDGSDGVERRSAQDMLGLARKGAKRADDYAVGAYKQARIARLTVEAIAEQIGELDASTIAAIASKVEDELVDGSLDIDVTITRRDAS